MTKAISLIDSPWQARINQANKYYITWEERFRCDTLENYYEGFQWNLANGVSTLEIAGVRRPYTVNLIYSTLKRKVANITYTYPQFILTPRPGQMDWNQDFAVQSSQIKEDTLNTIASDPRMELVDDIRLAAIDSFFRFSVIEVGYSIGWQNPNTPDIYLASHDDPTISALKDKVIDAPKLDPKFGCYTKWISARRFRVSMADDVKLRNCDWCGYFAYMPISVLKKTKGINFPENFEQNYYSVDIADATAYFNQEGYSTEAAQDMVTRGQIAKVWHIWDNITKKRLLLLDGRFQEMYSEDFERLPFTTHRTDISLKGWYPIPPVWQWLSPQNEVNEAREQMRRYRRRATRKFEVSKGKVDFDELEKMKSEIDGEVIVVKDMGGMPVIRPITNPQIDGNIENGLITAKDDFDIVAGIPVARGRASDRQTATATRAIQTDQGIIESIEQIDFSKFVAAIGREMLLQTGEKMPIGMWIKYTIDPGDEESIMAEVQSNTPIYKYITSQDLEDGYDFDVMCNVINSTPDQMQKELAAYVQFLSLMTQFPAIAMSTTLVRETAYRCGYKNEKVIKEYQKMAMLAMMEKANMAGQSLLAQGLMPQGGSAPNGQASGMAQQQMPNSLADIQSQLHSQVG